MRSKHLLLMLLLALMAPWVANAQSTPSTLTVYENDDDENYYIPVYLAYADADQHTQMIYPASVLEDMGTGATISQMVFYATASSDYDLGTWTVKLGETEATTLSGLDETTTLTQVYSNELVFDDDDNTLIFAFTADYTYQGGNLLIDITHEAADYYDEVNFLGNSAVTSASCYYFDYWGGYWYGGTQDFLPRVTFTHQGGTVSDCKTPVLANATLTTGNGTVATLSWTENGNSTSWVLQYGTNETFAANTYTEVVVNNNPTKSLTQLTPETTYYARVKPDCDTEGNKWSNVISFMPTSTIPFTINEGTSTTSTTNEYVPFYGYYADSGCKGQFIIPATDLTDIQWGTISRLTFYLYTPSNATFIDDSNVEAEFEVYMAIVPNTTFASNDLYDWNSMEKVMNATHFRISDSKLVVFLDTPFQYTGGNLMIGILESKNGGYTHTYWQGVSADGASLGGYGNSINQQNFLPKTTFNYLPGEEPSCYKPTSLTIGEVTNHTAEISWTKGSDEQAAWHVYYAADPTAPADDIALNRVIEVSTTPATTLTELDAETKYYVWVRSNCGNNDYSEWSGPRTFTTEIACAAPTVLTVSNLGSTTAQLSWTSDGDNFTVRYAPNPPVFFQGFVTDPSAMSDGADASWLKGEQGILGPSALHAYGELLADDFTISTATTLTEIEVYGYQTGSTTTSTFTGLYAQIYDGDPSNGGTVVWGDMETNLMTSTSFTNCYRGSDNTPTETTRPIMAITASGLDIDLPAGTYWLVYNMTGSSTLSGPWGVPFAEPTIGSTGKSLQYSTNNGWGALIDGYSNTPYGLAMRLKFGEGETFNWTTINDISDSEYELTSLDPETVYLVQVRSNCGGIDGSSEWVSRFLTTMEDCPKPEDVTISNIGHYTATVNWNGESDSFDVLVGQAVVTETYVSQDFSSGIPSTWTNTSNPEGHPWTVVNGHIQSGNAGVNSSTSTISFQYTLANDAVIEFDAECMGEGTSTVYDKCIFSIDGTAQFTYGALGEGFNHYSFDVAAGEHTFSWSYSKDSSVNPTGDYFAVDNITLTKKNIVWATPITVTENTYNFTDLNAGTKYYVKIVPSCNTGNESDVVNFTTVSPNLKYFMTEGNWDNENNWEPTGVPTIDQDVVLKANATIASGIAYAKSIAGTGTGTGAKTLTIESGAKLKHLNYYVTATVKKTITGYGAGNETNKANYYLIANPLETDINATSTPAISTTGLLTGNYDLYDWDYSASDGNEWRNYEKDAFDLYSAYSGISGYLYANEATTTLTFTGTINPYTNFRSSYLYATSSTTYDFPGWYLLGNPYLYDAYLASSSSNGISLPYYRLNTDGDDFVAVAATTVTPIAPMEGFFYQATTTGSVYVVTTAPDAPDAGLLNMNLRSGNKQLDNAILAFGSEQKLEKFSFRANSSKIYMPVEGKDYAITNAEAQGEMPVSFKAENNGSYTLSFSNENVEFGYLHLIDNMTGEDVNLLETPSYSFEAKTTDYASRFKLVFSTGNGVNEESFAFISDGNIILNGEGMLQVVDVMGRIMMQEENATSVSTSGMTPGVYVLRLINGDSVKTQKIVIK